jgi:hypothetical protein
MRRPHLLFVLAGLVLAASPAAAQLPEVRPRPKIVALPPPDAPDDAGLRGPIDPTAAPPGTSAPTPAPTSERAAAGATASSSPQRTGALIAAPTKLAVLPPLPVVGDTAPICRAECAKTRIFCAARTDGEDNCDVRWVECLSACAEPQSSPSKPVG